MIGWDARERHPLSTVRQFYYFISFFVVFAVVARVSPTVKFQLGLEVNVIVLEIFKQDEPATIFIDQEITIKHG